MWFYRQMLRIPWTENLSNNKVLKKITTWKILLIKIRKRAEIFEPITRKYLLENVLFTGCIEGRNDRNGHWATGAISFVRMGGRGMVKCLAVTGSCGKAWSHISQNAQPINDHNWPPTPKYTFFQARLKKKEYHYRCLRSQWLEFYSN